MAADLQLVGDTLSALQPFAQQEKCASCECLQGALVELRMALEELPESAERERLLSAVTQAMQIQNSRRRSSPRRARVRTADSPNPAG